MQLNKQDRERFRLKLSRLYKTEEWQQLKEFFMHEIIENAGIPDRHDFINGMKHIIYLPEECYEAEITKLKNEQK